MAGSLAEKQFRKCAAPDRNIIMDNGMVMDLQEGRLKNGTPHSRYFSDELGVPNLLVKNRTSVCYI